MRPLLFEIRFEAFTIYVYSYILLPVLSIILIMLFAFFVFRRNSLNRIVSLSGVVLILTFTVIGARLAGVLYKYPYYIDGLDKILSLKFGDFSLFGGLIFAVLGGYIFTRITSTDVLRISDSLVFPIGMGIILWRFGCFLNGCCIGRETDSVIGVCFDETGIKVHPTQIYELSAVVLILVILGILKKRIKKPGFFSLMFYASFSFSYLIVSLFREHTLYGIILSLILSIILLGEVIIIGIVETRKNRQ